MQHKVRRFAGSRASLRAQVAVVATFLFAFTSITTPLFEKPASAGRTKATKYSVCHRTNAIKNPYRLISVAWSSVNPDDNGHDNPVHDGPVFNVANPTASHGSTPRDSGLGSEAGGGNDRWGDIFNAYKASGRANSNSNNWTTEGQAIFNGATFTLNGATRAACRTMSATDYIKSEREENPGKGMSDIMGELDDMDAAEDVALKTALGGSFTSWHVDRCRATTDCESTTAVSAAVDAESPSVTTEPPTNVSTGSSSNAETGTLNGTVSPKGVSMVWYFEFDDDSDFTPGGSDTTDVLEVPGTPQSTSSSTTINASYNASGLNAGKTYYYRTVGVVTSGTGDTLVETYLYGVTESFSYVPPTTTTTTSTTVPPTTTTTTSTTVPPTTTTVAPVSVSAVGALNATVWIDSDGDEKKDASEVWIPGISIALTGQGAGTATTSKTGDAQFSSLAVGRYTVKATLPTGFNMAASWDSQGAVDWEVIVTVVAGQTALAEFAAKGNLEAVGTIQSVTPGTNINVDWSGLDRTLDTPDDVTFLTTVRSNQTFSLENIPSGMYRLRTSSLRTVVSVGAAGVTYENPSLTFVVRSLALPVTGSPFQPKMIPFVLIMILSGAMVLDISRRRRTY